MDLGTFCTKMLSQSYIETAGALRPLSVMLTNMSHCFLVLPYLLYLVLYLNGQLIGEETLFLFCVCTTSSPGALLLLGATVIQINNNTTSTTIIGVRKTVTKLFRSKALGAYIL